MDSYPFICGDCGSRHQTDQKLDMHRCQGNGLYNPYMQTQRDGGFFWTIAEHQHTQTQPHGSLPSPLAGHQQATYTQTQPDGGLSSPVSEHQQATQPDSGSSAAAKQRKPKNASQDLVRIRNNQRRSRARRKEYLQELEAKWANCQQMGIAATAEMQTAARKVLDENKILRAMLNERGVSNEEISDALSARTASLTSQEIPLPTVALAELLSSRRAVSSDPKSSRQQSEEAPPPPPPTPQQTAQLSPVLTPATTPSPETFPTVHLPSALLSGSSGEHHSLHDSFKCAPQFYTPSSQPYQNLNGLTSVPVTSYPGNCIQLMKEDISAAIYHLHTTPDPCGSNTYGVGHSPTYLPSEYDRNLNVGSTGNQQCWDRTRGIKLEAYGN